MRKFLIVVGLLLIIGSIVGIVKVIQLATSGYVPHPVPVPPPPQPQPDQPAFTVSPPVKLPRVAVNGMTFIIVPTGSFMMGSPDGEPGKKDAVVPETQALRTIAKRFGLSECEVTMENYWGVIDPAHTVSEDEKKLPISGISWGKAVEFCKKLSQENPGMTFRLPTEIEWEYACRAGDHQEMFAVWKGGSAGLNDALSALSRHDRHKLKIGAQASFVYTDNAGAPKPVASFPANAWGFFDMQGNVAEWCDYSPELQPPKLSNRPIRGGAYSSSELGCRSAHRAWEGQDRETDAIGFRVLLENP